MIRRLIYIIFCACALYACNADRVSDDSGMWLTLERDTVCFDTVFTGRGSATQRVMIYNTNDYAIRLSRVGLNSRYFHINLDGESNPTYMSGMEIRGGDSLYLFVKVEIDPTDVSTPIFVEDTLSLTYNGHTQNMILQAIGQNVHLIRSPRQRTDTTDCHFIADRPYLIYDSMLVYGQTTIDAGARLYFHQGALLWCMGDVTAEGTESQPIALLGDRLDMLFRNVPYSVTSGQWGGLSIFEMKGETGHRYKLNYVHTSGASQGLYVYSYNNSVSSSLMLDHCKIHNHLLYGIAIQNVNSEVRNTEISNVARRCVHIAGGKHAWDYTTVANYFYNTNINIHHIPADSVLRWRYQMPVVYVDTVGSEPIADLTLTNSLVTGLNKQILTYAIDSLRPTDFPTCWVHSDTAHIFRNTYYEYKVYDYYDFRLDSLSPARYAAKDSTDAGCYPYEAY